ncbi:WD40 repeat domain-containing serine/threonine protein kinase [Nonomuraea candida]|uniref:WD40 repeat domain-containing serine/threonine protein kinase n=1 Tax=Nonomuraea candida TaxID=359159 RepID=UPI00069425A7|nr:WD40 repeat domain-containing serine/threonine protein kinase [Nonomuraea candida]
MSVIQPLREEDPTGIGSCRLVGRLGASTYLGETGDGARVVVKVLPADVDPGRFLRAVEPLRDVSAFCTAQVLGSGTLADGRPFVISEFIDGPTLREAVAAGEPPRDAALHRFAVGTVTALVALHQTGAVHGDLGPDTVVLGPDGPRVIGLGLARALESTGGATTRKVEVPAFTAPERLRGDEPGPAADLFSWGATIAYAASGRSPFDGGSMAGTVNRIARAEPELPPELGDLSELVLACLDKDPARRPAASEVLLRLVGETSLLTGTAPGAARGTRDSAAPSDAPEADLAEVTPAVTAPRRRRSPMVIAVAAFVAGAVLSGGGVYALTSADQRERPVAAAPAGSAGAAPSQAPSQAAGQAGATPGQAGATPGRAGAVPGQADGTPGRAGAVLTAPPQVTAEATVAPVPPVAKRADRDVKLPDLGATLHEHPSDALRLAAYLQAKEPFKAFARDASGTFKEVGFGEEPVVSPDGAWVALNPWLKFQDSDLDQVRFVNLKTGERFSVTTVRKPKQTWFPSWSRDGRRLVLSITDEKRTRISGFALVDVAARTARVVESEYADDITLAFTFTPDGGLARGYHDGDAIGVDFYNDAGQVIRSMHWVGKPRNRDWFSPSGKLFATICPKGGNVCVWNAETGVRVATVPGIGPKTGLLGWFDEAHLLVQEPDGKRKNRAEVRIVDLAGDVSRVLADVNPVNGALNWAPPAR